MSAIDTQVWADFQADPEKVAAEAEAAYERHVEATRPVDEQAALDDLRPPEGPTDRKQLVRVRRVQRFFRAAVLTSYQYRCALTGLDVPDLLCASHIVPWAASVERRADPRNGLCLNALLDRAFDRGYITFDQDFSLLLSPRLTPCGTVSLLSSPRVGR